MKLMIRDYLASLKERDELDAILPDILSERGFHIFSRPRRGTTQHGVDVAAVGNDEDGERKVFLYSLKAGDLTRQEWDGSPQALRPSLDEMLDVYIPTRIPKRYAGLKVVVCLCFGGDVHEQVRASVTGFTAKNTSDRVSFDELNGDRLADIILSGLLREEVLPPQSRSAFRKAVAMVAEPDISFKYYAQLITEIKEAAGNRVAGRVSAARRMHLCLWVLFAWARDAGNLEAAYRASELALLHTWDLFRDSLGQGRPRSDVEPLKILHHQIQLHLAIAAELLERKVFPHASVRHGLSFGVGALSQVDVSLALFDLLGRIGLLGLWFHWLANRSTGEMRTKIVADIDRIASAGLTIIESNPVLDLPVADHQATDVALFLLLTGVTRATHTEHLLGCRERWQSSISRFGRAGAIRRSSRRTAT